MRVAVMGGAGFIGSQLVAALLRLKHTVLVYDKAAPRAPVAHVQADILDTRRLTATMQAFQPEVVYHLAALSFIPECEARPERAFRVNVEGTFNVMRALQDCGQLRGGVFASSADVYGLGKRASRESDPVAPLGVYGLTKALGEQIVREFGYPFVLARIFNTYGPGDTNPHLIPNVIRQLRAGAKQLRLGRLDTYRDFIYVNDVVRALLAMSKLGGRETLNIGSGKETASSEVVATLCRLVGASPAIIHRESLLRSVDREHHRCDNRRARRILAWNPRVGIDAGLRKLLRCE